MKKVICLIFIMFLLPGCSRTKKPLTVDGFIGIMNGHGLPADDVTEYYDEGKYESVVFTSPEGTRYSIGFFKCPSIDAAKKDFAWFANDFDESFEGLVVPEYKHGENYDWLGYDGTEFYCYLSRIDDTFIVVNIATESITDKDEATKLIKELGY